MAMTYPFAQGHTDDADEKAGEKKQLKSSDRFPITSSAGRTVFFSSANELARFAVALLNDGKIEGKQAISPSVIKGLRTPRVDIPAVGDKQRGEHHRYGYGMQFSIIAGFHWRSTTAA
jgi:CubicO group peptidase (beta-lactamase class C family)